MIALLELSHLVLTILVNLKTRKPSQRSLNLYKVKQVLSGII